ncbi:MAG: glycosyltransferase [Patescibacteria group bacterium]
MFLSIVIPTKNEELNLPFLLESIKTQEFTDYEIIVADAQSTDKTRAIAVNFKARIIEGGKTTPGRNLGAAAALGQTLLFLDADVVLPNPKFLSDNLSEMERKHANVATCKVRPLSENVVDKALHGFYNAYAIGTEKIMPHAPGFCIFAQKHAHDAINGFDEALNFAEDHDYVQRAKKAGFKFSILRSHPIMVSVRRVERDGRLGTAVRYTKAEIHKLARGHYKNEKDYVMGGDAYKPKAK